METQTATCESGQVTGEKCNSTSPAFVRIEHIPEHLRASHEAAGNRGRWPVNGAIHLTVCQACADELLDDNWTFEL